MLIYYIFLFFAVLLVIREQWGRDNKVFLKIYLFALILLAGLRYHVGEFDYGVYEKYFHSHEYGLNEYFEIGYSIINSIIYSLTGSFHLLLTLIALFNLTVLYECLNKYTTFVAAVLFLYVADLYTWQNFVIMRQSVAMTLFWYSLRYIQTKQIFKYSICILFSTFFHSSAIVLAPLYFLLNIQLNSRKNLIFLAFASAMLLLVFANLERVLMPLVSLGLLPSTSIHNLLVYAQNNVVEFSIVSLLEIVPVLFLLFYYRDRDLAAPYTNIFKNLFFCSIATTILSWVAPILGRFTNYFQISFYLLIPHLVAQFKTKNMQIIAYLLIIPYFTLKFILKTLAFGEGEFAGNMANYQSIFFNFLEKLP